MSYTVFPSGLTHTNPRRPDNNNDRASAARLLRLIRRVDISPGSVSILLDRDEFATSLPVGPDRIREEVLRIHAPFRLRRRGVETKLVLGNPTKSVDRTLLRNIANALSWLDRIKAGKTYEEIAIEDAIPKARVRKAIGYAFMAPRHRPHHCRRYCQVEAFRANPTPRYWQRRALKPHHLAARFELETST